MDKKIVNFINNKIELKRQNNEKFHYAFLLSKNELVSEGRNSFIENKTCTTIHAEINALEKIKNIKNINSLQKHNLIVIKIKKNGDIGEGKPCSHCIYLLSESKIKITNVYYSTSINFIIKEKFSKMKINEDNKLKMSKSSRYKCGDKIYYC